MSTCKYCDRQISCPANMKRHESACSSNPETWRTCEGCGETKSFRGITCSTGCYNAVYRSGPNNPNWKVSNYQSTCFHYHEKKCIVCGEEKIVAVHHVNENHKDNRPENLVPLCPTHHQYVHSRYRNEIQPIIETYLSGISSV